MVMTYSFSTRKGTALAYSIPVPTDTTGYTLSVEFSPVKSFASPVTKAATGSGTNVQISLTANEVDSIGDSYYRVKGVKSGVTSELQSGTINQLPRGAASGSVLTSGYDRNDNIRTIRTDAVGRQKISHAQPDVISANLVAIGDALIIDLDSLSDVQFFMRGAAHAGYNLTFEYSPNTTAEPGYMAAATPADGDWYPALAKNVGVISVPATSTGVLTANSTSSWETSVPAAVKVRARVTARTSGTLTVSGTASTAARPVQIGVTGAVTVTSVTPGSTAASLGKVEDAAHATGDVGVAIWGVRAPATPAAPTSAVGDYSYLMVDAEGKIIPVGSADPVNTVQAISDLTLTTDVAIIAAGAAGIRTYVTELTFDNTGAAAARVIVSDGATRLFTATVPAGSTFQKTFNTPLRGTAATALNVKLGAAGTVTVSVQGYRGI